MVPTLLEDDVPIVFKQAFISACLSVTLEEKTLPWNPTINSMYDSICTPLRRIFIQTVKAELSSSPTIVNNLSTLGSKKVNGVISVAEKKMNQQQVATLLQSMLKLFRLDPLSALLVNVVLHSI